MHKNLVKFGRVVFELCEQTDKQTDKQAYSLLITIRCTLPWGKVKRGQQR